MFAGFTGALVASLIAAIITGTVLLVLLPWGILTALALAGVLR